MVVFFLFVLLILGLIIVAVLVYFWYITITVITLIAVSWWWSRKPEIACPGCDKKYRRKGGLANHMETCDMYQYRIKKEWERKEEWKRDERKRREDESQQEQQKRKREEEFRKKQNDWKKNWRDERKWDFTQEEFWIILHDIDKRKSNATKGLEKEKERATKKLYDELKNTFSEFVEDKINEKIEEIEDEYDERIEKIEEEYEEEEQKLWDQRYYYDWYKMSDEERRAKENWDKAKQDYKKSTGREWHDDWEKNWEEAFAGMSGHRINLDECYEELGLSKDATFDEVKKRYRELVLKYHPDKSKDKQDSEERFKKIVEAYETIKKSVAV